MSAKSNTPSQRFLKECRGNFSTLFALSAPILALCMGGGIDFSNIVAQEDKTQSAADSAALVATTAMVNSLKAGAALTDTQAAAIGTQYFNANAPAQVLSGESTMNVSTTYSSSTGVVTTTVYYSGSVPSLVGGFVGSSSFGIDIAAKSTATVTTTTATPVGTVTGSGWIAEDPVVDNNNGIQFMDMCDVTHATWYNILSDSNFEVNANCDGVAGNWAELYQIDVMAATHTISFNPVMQGVDWYGITIYRQVWSGAVTIDGTSYAAPSVAGTTTLLNDTANGITVKMVVGQPGVSGTAANYAQITAPNYTVIVAYDSDDNGSYNLGFASINLSAVNAGSCGTPGGLWGQTLTEGQDTNAADFVVATPTTVTSGFSRTCSVTTTSATGTTLIQ